MSERDRKGRRYVAAHGRCMREGGWTGVEITEASEHWAQRSVPVGRVVDIGLGTTGVYRILPTDSPALFQFSHEERSESPALVRLVLFGYTGGSVTALQSLFGRLPPWAEVWGAEYPGRGLRWREPLTDSLSVLVDAFDNALHKRQELPLVLFGYSFGALVAFALAQRFSRRKQPAIGLVAMSAKSPRHVVGERKRTSLGDDRLKADLRTLGGIPDEVWRRPDFLEMVLAVVRSDLHCYEAFERDDAISIGCPVMALHGGSDPLIGKEQMNAWLSEAGGARELSEFHSLEGGHFLHCDQESTLRGLITPWLQKLLKNNGTLTECKAG